jgi:23S rRNA-/tRNA-specific pseudouridylate synthase
MIAEIIFENEDAYVLNKASKVHTLRGRDRQAANLQDWIEDTSPSQSQLPESGILQRLDFLTSGCLLVAKNKKSYSDLKEKIKLPDYFEKIYLVVAQKLIPNQEISFHFTNRYRSSKKILVMDSGKPKTLGRTQIAHIQSKGGLFLYQARILGGGKRHQIRASFSRLDAPILGDVLYGGVAHSYFGLHSWRLRCPTFQAEACPSFSQDFDKIF